MGSFQDDTRVEATGGALSARFSPDWEVQGPSGGYKSAIALRAAGAVAPSGWRPASYTGVYLRPGVRGPVEVVAAPLRSGRRALCVEVRLRQEDLDVHQAQVWVAAPPAAGAPGFQPPCEAPVLHDPLAADAAPPLEVAASQSFWRNFDARPCRPCAEASFARWIRFRGYQAHDADGHVDRWLDAARAVVLMDNWLWPAHRARGAADDAATSLDLSVWFHAPADASAWLRMEAWADVAHGGLIHGHGRVWTDAGGLVATGGSQFLWLGPR